MIDFVDVKHNDLFFKPDLNIGTQPLTNANVIHCFVNRGQYQN